MACKSDSYNGVFFRKLKDNLFGELNKIKHLLKNIYCKPDKVSFLIFNVFLEKNLERFSLNIFFLSLRSKISHQNSCNFLGKYPLSLFPDSKLLASFRNKVSPMTSQKIIRTAREKGRNYK